MVKLLRRVLTISVVAVLVALIGMTPASSQTQPDVTTSPAAVRRGDIFGLVVNRPCDARPITVTIPDVGLSADVYPDTWPAGSTWSMPRDAALGSHQIVVGPDTCGYTPGSVDVLPAPPPVVYGAVADVGQPLPIEIEPGSCLADTLTVTLPGTGREQVIANPPARSTIQAVVTAPFSPGVYPIVVTADGCHFPDAVATITSELTLNVTVGTQPGVCATTGHLWIPQPTTVYYCYTLTNDRGGTFTHHRLVDDTYGPVIPDLAFDLAYGESVNTIALGYPVSAVVDHDTTDVAVWSSQYYDTRHATWVTVAGSGSATVTIGVEPTQPALPAAVSPAFTG